MRPAYGYAIHALPLVTFDHRLFSSQLHIHYGTGSCCTLKCYCWGFVYGAVVAISWHDLWYEPSRGWTADLVLTLTCYLDMIMCCNGQSLMSEAEVGSAPAAIHLPYFPVYKPGPEYKPAPCISRGSDMSEFQMPATFQMFEDDFYHRKKNWQQI